MSAAPAERNQVRTRCQRMTAPGPTRRKKSTKSAPRGSLSLDNGGPHKGSARPPRHVRLLLVCPACLLDHLIGQDEERRGERDPEGLGGLEVEDQLELRGLLHGQVCWLGALQNSVHIDRGTPEQVHITRCIRHETSCIDKLPV